MFVWTDIIYCSRVLIDGTNASKECCIIFLFLTCMIARQQQNREKCNNSECKSILIKEKRIITTNLLTADNMHYDEYIQIAS